MDHSQTLSLAKVLLNGARSRESPWSIRRYWMNSENGLSGLWATGCTVSCCSVPRRVASPGRRVVATAHCSVRCAERVWRHARICTEPIGEGGPCGGFGCCDPGHGSRLSRIPCLLRCVSWGDCRLSLSRAVVHVSRRLKPANAPFPPDAWKPIGDSLGGATRSVPEAGDPVLIKHRISTHDSNGLNQALSHEEPVKRISVVEWQSSLPFGELQRDWGHCDAEVSQRPLHPLAIRQRQRKFLEACLNGEFPDRPDAYRQFNGGVFKDGSGTGTEPTRVVQRLDQGVGIQKMPHSIYAVKSSSGASKSGAMYRTVPFMVPSWR